MSAADGFSSCCLPACLLACKPLFPPLSPHRRRRGGGRNGERSEQERRGFHSFVSRDRKRRRKKGTPSPSSAPHAESERERERNNDERKTKKKAEGRARPALSLPAFFSRCLPPVYEPQFRQGRGWVCSCEGRPRGVLAEASLSSFTSFMRLASTVNLMASAAGRVRR